MKNELINVNFESERPTVSARELHNFLDVGTAYKDWFPRMCEYGFIEGVDFCSFLSESTGGRPAHDAQLTIEMAKEISMLQRNEKGQQIRRYFLELEKKWNSPEMIMKRALEFADAKVRLLEQQLDEQKPLVDFANHVSSSSDAIDIGDFAKMVKNENIDIGRNRLFTWLRNNKYLMDNNVPYQRYIDNGYFKVIETEKTTAYGTKLFSKTLISGRGQIVIIEKLRAELNLRVA